MYSVYIYIYMYVILRTLRTTYCCCLLPVTACYSYSSYCCGTRMHDMIRVPQTLYGGMYQALLLLHTYAIFVCIIYKRTKYTYMFVPAQYMYYSSSAAVYVKYAIEGASRIVILGIYNTGVYRYHVQHKQFERRLLWCFV